MSTLVSITVYTSQDEQHMEACFGEIQRYENQLSKFLPFSEIYRMNHRSTDQSCFPISAETADILATALRYAALTNGLFDITMEPLLRLWKINSESPVIPEPVAILSALQDVGYKNLHLSSGSPATLTFLKPGMQIDLGGIAKGYIADRIKDLLQERGVARALINLGGNIVCFGGRPDGTAFRIGIQKPFAVFGENQLILCAKDLSIVSSGAYARNFKQNNVFYHHILDPRTGYPCETDVASATILSEKSIDGDGLSTGCFALGTEKAIALLHSLDGVYGIFVTNQGQIRYSSGASAFVLTNP